MVSGSLPGLGLSLAAKRFYRRSAYSRGSIHIHAQSRRLRKQHSGSLIYHHHRRQAMPYRCSHRACLRPQSTILIRLLYLQPEEPGRGMFGPLQAVVCRSDFIFNPSNGVISGTPTSNAVRDHRTVPRYRLRKQHCHIRGIDGGNVLSGSLTISTAALPVASIRHFLQSHSLPLEAPNHIRGHSGTDNCLRVSQSAPTGQVTGIPTIPGLYTFSIQVIDATGVTGSRGFTFR